MSDSGIFKFDDEKYRYIPGPLFTIVKEFHIEENVFKKAHRLINLFEWIYKWHSVLVVSDLMRGNKIAEDMKLFLSQVLREPSMGNWYYIFDYALEEMSAFSIAWVNLETLRAKHKRHSIVSFRNKYAHGAMPDDDECILDCKEYYPVLQDLLDSKMMKDLRLLVGHSGSTIMLLGPDEISVEKDVPSGQAAVLLPDGQLLDIWPLGVYQEDPLGIKGKGFYFFNSIRQKKEAIEQLSYELPSLRRNTNFWRPFLKVFPLKDWGQLPGWDFENFRSNIEQLTENFKGRELEQREIKDFMLNGHGTFMVWGGPGIGKSALVAKALKVVRAESSKTSSPSNVIIIEYFIERSSFYASVTEYLRYVNKKLDKYYKIKGIPIGNDESEMRMRLEERLNRIENKINNEMVLLVVDGLDECPEIRNYIPKSRYWLNVLILSREIVEVKDWWRTHDRENKSEKNLEKLSDNEIISLLYDVVDKYQKGFNKEYVFEVCRRSEGNPLYLKLLCDQIYDHGGMVESIDKIPTSLTDLYASTLKRISQQQGGAVALNVLRILAVAKDALSVNMIRLILSHNNKIHIDTQEIINGIDLCRELLFEKFEKNIKEYKFFHDSLRSWIEITYHNEKLMFSGLLAWLCRNWREFSDYEAKVYCFKFAAEHLYDVGDEDGMWELINDKEYFSEQLKYCENFNLESITLKNAVTLYENSNRALSLSRFLYAAMRLRRVIRDSEGRLFSKAKQYLFLNLSNIDLDEIKSILFDDDYINNPVFLNIFLHVLDKECSNYINKIVFDNHKIILMIEEVFKIYNVSTIDLRFISNNFCVSLIDKIYYIFKSSNINLAFDFSVLLIRAYPSLTKKLIRITISKKDSCYYDYFILLLKFVQEHDSTELKDVLFLLVFKCDMVHIKKLILNNILTKYISYCKQEYEINHLLITLVKRMSREGMFRESLSVISHVHEEALIKKLVFIVLQNMIIDGRFEENNYCIESYMEYLSEDDIISLEFMNLYFSKSPRLNFKKIYNIKNSAVLAFTLANIAILTLENNINDFSPDFVFNIEDSSIQFCVLKWCVITCSMNNLFQMSISLIDQYSSCQKGNSSFLVEILSHWISRCDNFLELEIFIQTIDLALRSVDKNISIIMIDIACGLSFSGHIDYVSKCLDEFYLGYKYATDDWIKVSFYKKLSYIDTLYPNNDKVLYCINLVRNDIETWSIIHGILSDHHYFNLMYTNMKLDEYWVILDYCRRISWNSDAEDMFVNDYLFNILPEDSQKLYYIDNIYKLFRLGEGYPSQDCLVEIAGRVYDLNDHDKAIEYIKMIECRDLAVATTTSLLWQTPLDHSIYNELLNLLRGFIYNRDSERVLRGYSILLDSLVEKGFYQISVKIFFNCLKVISDERDIYKIYDLFCIIIIPFVKMHKKYQNHSFSGHFFKLLSNIKTSNNVKFDIFACLIINFKQLNMLSLNFFSFLDGVLNCDLFKTWNYLHCAIWCADVNYRSLSLYYFRKAYSKEFLILSEYRNAVDIFNTKCIIVIEMARCGFYYESNNYFTSLYSWSVLHGYENSVYFGYLSHVFSTENIAFHNKFEFSYENKKYKFLSRLTCSLNEDKIYCLNNILKLVIFNKLDEFYIECDTNQNNLKQLFVRNQEHVNNEAEIFSSCSNYSYDYDFIFEKICFYASKIIMNDNIESICDIIKLLKDYKTSL
ncbi:ATP-binding protein [Desulfomicrobium baculatum]|uniref:UvrC family homology region profile domain-containing protein n=1 Tax=Desulfomicrobium baculatum (strain DSM 4028 / VKM B-1378 / X) TaxID=525897 RepID=C7LRX2_DESBD|nr:ATP-binding protein [Desulfomicrobium baculatum]ACU89355.1 hypothetical protein Dbac_1252 [Desulfomicrobium baculatum DSM 4028]